ncbi:MAG: hypothetical protein GWP04_10275 [Gammaproteobacteria bacterium]|nr:hypothetical protein [Gammaproteobacteria bacterium]
MSRGAETSRAVEPPVAIPGRSLTAVAAAAGIGAGLLSLLMRPSYDEFFWLAIARKAALGGSLYRDAIDNKTPVVYGLSWLLDRLPGPYVTARALLVGAAVGITTYIVARMAGRHASRTHPAMLAGVVAGCTLLLQNQLVYTTELIAVPLLLVSLLMAIRKRAVLAVLAATFAAGFDPRVLILLPGIVVLVWQEGGTTAGRRALAWTLIVTALGVGTVLAVPDLRFALVELNLASRPVPTGPLLLLFGFAAARSILPLAALLYLFHPADMWSRLRTADWILVGGSVLLGIVSIQPFDHYWGYVLVPLPLVLGTIPPVRMSRAGAGLLIAALIPMLALTVVVGIRRSETERKYLQVASSLEAQLDASQTFASADDQPYLAAMLPEHNALRSPTLGYLVWASSRQSDFLAELPLLLDSATVLVDDGILDVPRSAVTELYRPVWDLFEEYAPDFACRTRVGDISLRFRCIEKDPHG